MNAQEKEPLLVIETEFGEIKIKLYNETSLHRDNFIKLVEAKLYDGLPFHRVIKDFMIQGGDLNLHQPPIFDNPTIPDSSESIPAEIIYPKYYHKKGALAAARLGDEVNPEKTSSVSQFYIITGRIFSEQELHLIEKQKLERLKQSILSELQAKNKDTVKEFYKQGKKEKLTELRTSLIEAAQAESEKRKEEVLFNDIQKQDYTTNGGTPHLDGEYTVFGEVIEGMEVIDKIQNSPTDLRDKPLQKILMNIKLLKE